MLLPVSFLLRNKYENIWLISERGIDARDNAFHMYKYIKECYPDIDVRYVLSSNSPDRNKIDAEDVVDYRSFEHFFLFMQAKILISTHVMGCSPRIDAFTKMDKYHLLYTNGKRVYLQHGISKDDFKKLDSKKIGFFDMMCFGSIKEYEAALRQSPYRKNVFKYTGFARFDKLYQRRELEIKSENYILFMPTWRVKFANYSDKDFMNTNYYKSCYELITDERLIQYLKNNGLNLIFYPHIEMHHFNHLYKHDLSTEVIVADTSMYDVQELFFKCKLMITDFSSVFFDFAFLNKPVIYYQFDYKEYRESQYPEGWFSYKKNGFGPVYESKCELVDYLMNTLKQDCLVEKKYQKRVNDFFGRIDENNRERIMSEIMSLLS